PSGPSAGSGFPFGFISSAQAQEVPETEVDPAVEEEAAKNEAVLQAREIALEREALAQRADLATVKGNAEIKAAAAKQPNPLEPFLTLRNPALDASAERLRGTRTNQEKTSLPTVGLPAEGEDAANTGGFGNEAQFLDHYARHGSDFRALTPNEYAQQAGRLLNGPAGPTTLEMVRRNGDIVRYDPTTDEFGVVKPDGTIRTFYKPDPAVHGYPTNLDYFNAQ
ncbi:MAG: hypothetical protein WCC64_03915, partial [Aliidongia sp.]